MTEVTGRTLARAIIDRARELGWTVAHFPPVQTAHGFRVPVGADGKGWPDLVLVKGRVLFREVKGGVKGKQSVRLRPDQAKWQSALALAGADVGVWTLQDWHDGTIEEELRSRLPGLGGVMRAEPPDADPELRQIRRMV